MPRFFRRLSEGVFDIEILKLEHMNLQILSENVPFTINLI